MKRAGNEWRPADVILEAAGLVPEPLDGLQVEEDGRTRDDRDIESLG